MKKCSVPDCDRKSRTKGLCPKHYHRLRKHGDPLGGGTPHGEPMSFYKDVVLRHEGNECLIWPYNKNNMGYAMLNKVGLVSRAVCEEVNGPPPTPKHEAAHSCGNGHLGCVAKKHLSWKTSKENKSDKLMHGTHLEGERHPNSKLTEEQVKEILQLKKRLPQRKIASEFGVHQTTISLIHRGVIWQSLENSHG